MLLLLLPIIVERLPRPLILTDGRTWIGGVIRLLTVVLPAFADEWVEVYANNPFYFLLLTGLILLLLRVGTRLERTLRDDARRVWRLTLEGGLSTTPTSWVQTFRDNRHYQRFVQLFKWYVLPDWVFAPVTVV